jgi:hypothetical protein
MMLRTLILIAGLTTLIVLMPTVQASAGVPFNTSNNTRASSYKCKSGVTVPNKKACKEYGGHI